VAEERSVAQALFICAVSTPLWCVENCDRIVRWRWDEEAVVFDAASGATHLLSSGADAVLNALMACPSGLSISDLRLKLSTPSVCEEGYDEADSDAVLATILDGLEHIGLAQSGTP
jgi:PqqD family protein of HPr-rel-A system